MQRLHRKMVINLAIVNKIFTRRTYVSAVNNTTKATQKLKSWKQIPGPPSLPFIGPLLNFTLGGKMTKYKGQDLSRYLYETYGPIVRIGSMLGFPEMIWLYDADATENILRSENVLPIRPGLASLEYYRKHHNKTYDPNELTGLGSDQGENWKKFRSSVNPIMLRSKTMKLYTNVLDEVADDMIKRIKCIRDDKNLIRETFGTEVKLWALESVGVIALGTRLNCFDPNLPEDSVVRKLIQNVHDFFAIIGKVDLEPNPWRYYETQTFKKAMKIYEEQERLTYYFIDKTISKLQQSKKDNSNSITSNSEKPILEKLLEMDVRLARIMAMDSLAAGIDTVSNTALAIFYLLAVNPKKQDKLREELKTKESGQTYLWACIKETMRIMPVVSGISRLTTKDYNLLGYRIPKDFMIVLQHQTMSNMEKYFPKPKEFIPERWIAKEDDHLYYGHAHPFANLPFGFGVRMCIGRRIAELEIETFVTKIIKNFHIEWEGPPPNIVFTMLNNFTEPFNFVFKDI